MPDWAASAAGAKLLPALKVMGYFIVKPVLMANEGKRDERYRTNSFMKRIYGLPSRHPFFSSMLSTMIKLVALGSKSKVLFGISWPLYSSFVRTCMMRCSRSIHDLDLRLTSLQ